MHPEHNTQTPYKVINLRRSSVSEPTNFAVVLNWYEKVGKGLVGEEPIKDLTVDQVLELFDAPFWNKLYHCWAMEPSQFELIQPKVNHQIDPEKYSYFIEIYKVN